VNNDLNNNQHYITESFVKKRFGTDGFVKRYDVKWDKWKLNASPQFVFSGKGYTQLLIDGEPVENSLEESFSKLESRLKCILPVLDRAAKNGAAKFNERLYRDFCFYCSYLWHLSPYAKAKATPEYVHQLDIDLKHGNVKHLQDLQVSEANIVMMQKLHADGYKFIIQGQNYMQWVFRTQFVRNTNKQAGIFRHFVQWKVYNSPIELPISDIALVDYPERGNAATLFILPLSPHLVLVGKLEYGTPMPYYSTDTVIHGDTLSPETAEDILDVICLSGIKAIACKNKMDIAAYRERAKQKKIGFTKITDLEAVLSASTKTFNPEKDFRLIQTNTEGFVKFCHSFVLP